jgi:hypothetical protein
MPRRTSICASISICSLQLASLTPGGGPFVAAGGCFAPLTDFGDAGASGAGDLRDTGDGDDFFAGEVPGDAGPVPGGGIFGAPRGGGGAAFALPPGGGGGAAVGVPFRAGVCGDDGDASPAGIGFAGTRGGVAARAGETPLPGDLAAVGGTGAFLTGVGAGGRSGGAGCVFAAAFVGVGGLDTAAGDAALAGAESLAGGAGA